MLKESFAKALKQKASKEVSVDKPEELEKMSKSDLLASVAIDRAISKGSTSMALDIAKITGEFDDKAVVNVSLGQALSKFKSDDK